MVKIDDIGVESAVFGDVEAGGLFGLVEHDGFVNADGEFEHFFEVFDGDAFFVGGRVDRGGSDDDLLAVVAQDAVDFAAAGEAVAFLFVREEEAER